MEGEKTIPFRTITRYSATLSAGTTNDTQAGEEGKSIEVYRVMKTAKGEKKKLLSLDFYAAVPAVITKSSQEEQAPVVVPPTEETPSEDGTDSETPDESNPEDSQMDGTVETPDSPTSPDSPESPTVPDEDNQGDPASPVDDESTGKAVG